MLDFNSLPKESQKLFCTLYKHYLECRKNGQSIQESSYIGDSDYIQNNLYSDLPLDDVSAICWNLKSLGFIACYPGDDLANGVTITSEARAFMENKFKNDVKNIAKFIFDLIK